MTKNKSGNLLLWVLVVFILGNTNQIQAQDCVLNYRSPVQHETVLSGSFGEPRTRHFHAGIDFKQKRGVPFDTIVAVEDGFISRISVQGDGYGNALYIDHPCNKTSVYAHLHTFSPKIGNYIDSILTSTESYTINHVPEAKAMAVKKGDFIGILGNTGRSSGPHLHFEIRNTETETPYNPALEGFKPNDNIPPTIVGLMIYAIGPNEEEYEKAFHSARYLGNGEYDLSDTPIVVDHLKIGLGLRTFDQMNGASNHNGIYKMTMNVDGQTRFKFSLDSVPFEQSKYIHSHMDFEEKTNNRYVSKCFVNPGNQLDFYQVKINNGTIYPFEFRPSNIEIIAEDIEGNSARLVFQLIRRSDQLSQVEVYDSTYHRITREDSLGLAVGKSQVFIYPNTFSHPVHFKFTESKFGIDLRQEKSIPIFRRIKLRKELGKISASPSAYTFTIKNKKGEVMRLLSRWEGDQTLVTFVDEMDQYQIQLDTIPPTIQLASGTAKIGDKVVFKVTDNFIPTHRLNQLKIRVEVNKRWVLCRMDAKSDRLWFRLPNQESPSSYHILVQAIDASGNTSIFEDLLRL